MQNLKGTLVSMRTNIKGHLHLQCRVRRSDSLICSVLVQTGETHEQGHRGDDAIRGEPEEDV